MNPAYVIFVMLVWFLSTYFLVLMLLTILSKGREFKKNPDPSCLGKLPKVSIIVPAFNEEKTIAASIDSLKKIDYPKELLEIIIINDGSTDSTSSVVRKNIKEKYIRFIDNAQNKGKAACLNQGILAAKGDFVATMDADSEASVDILKKALPYFSDAKAAAVTVSVKVKDPKNLLQKTVAVEYAVGLSLLLKVLSYFDCVNVTPGPFSLYRKSVLVEIGLFDERNITEDLEIAYRLQKARYRIANCTTTCVSTVVPSTFKALHKQRKRWYSGALLTFWKHKGLLFNPKAGLFGFFLPYNLLMVILGLGLFFISTYLTISNTARSLSFFAFTNFNFLSYLNLNSIDPLSFGFLSMIGIFATFCTIAIGLVGLSFSKMKLAKTLPGFLGYISIFLFYQLFWASSFYTVLFRRELKWR